MNSVIFYSLYTATRSPMRMQFMHLKVGDTVPSTYLVPHGSWHMTEHRVKRKKKREREDKKIIAGMNRNVASQTFNNKSECIVYLIL